MSTNVPLEIFSAMRAPGITYQFVGYETYAVTFKTDASVLAAMLPGQFKMIPDSDVAILTINRFNVDIVRGDQGEVVADGNYYEMILTIPALYTSANGETTPKTYMSQLYLGSIEPESCVLPTMLGQVIFGFPKREAKFDVKDFAKKEAIINVERFGATIVDVKLKRGEVLSKPETYMDEGDFVLFKAIPAVPSVDGPVWDALQLVQVGSTRSVIEASCKVVHHCAVDAIFNGSLALDTGRILPIVSVEKATFTEVEGFGKPSAAVLHDFLKAP